MTARPGRAREEREGAQWVIPISDVGETAHLVPQRNGSALVTAACKKLVNLDFAIQKRYARRCKFCKREMVEAGR